MYFLFFSSFCFSVTLSSNGNLVCDSYDCTIDLGTTNTKTLKDVKNFVDNKYPLYEMYDDVSNATLFYFITSYLVEPMSYSGKPLELLIGIDNNCYIRDIRLLKHSEPIILVGIPLSTLLTAVSSYKNKCIKETLDLGTTKIGAHNNTIIKPITSATVTSIALHDTIIKSVRLVACDLGFIKKEYNTIKLHNNYKEYTWDYLIKIGAVKHFVFKKFNKDSAVLDIFFAEVTHPSVGINLFGEEEYYYLQSLLGENESMFFIINNGSWSFKGSGFVRGGLFERFHIKQDGNTFFFHDYDFRKMSNIVLKHCPKYKESGLFIIKSKLFMPAKNWDLIFMFSESVNEDKKIFETINISYEVPPTFVEKNLSTSEKVWFDNFFYLLIYFFLWFFIVFNFILKKELVKFSHKFFDFFYICILCILIVFLGCFCGGQPSVVNVFAFTNFLIKGVSITTFLYDPFFLISWFFIVLTLFLWGRAFFCGWICPFGSLQELLFRLREFFLRNIYSIEFFGKNTKILNYLRFFIFLFLFCLSFYSLEKAEVLSEIEPFKTIWNISLVSRGFLSFYAIFILISSLLMYRWFCRFICPLGAFLSYFSKFSKFKILRRNACVKCNICRKLCKSKAINNYGQIDVTKCIGCFDCVNAMYDNTICPPLINKKIWVAFNEKN